MAEEIVVAAHRRPSDFGTLLLQPRCHTCSRSRAKVCLVGSLSVPAVLLVYAQVPGLVRCVALPGQYWLQVGPCYFPEFLLSKLWPVCRLSVPETPA